MKFSKLTFALALWFSAWLYADGPVVRLTFVEFLNPPEVRFEGNTRFEVRERHYGGSGVHVGGGCIVTAKHTMREILTTDNEWQLRVNDLRIDEVEQCVSESVDIAIMYCEEIKSFDALPIATDGHETEWPVVVSGYPGESTELTEESGELVGEWEHGHTLTCEVQDGMSGGPVVDSSGHLVGIIVTATNNPEDFEEFGRSSVVSGEVFQRFCCNNMELVCPTWRPMLPVLHVWTSNTCAPCRQFWADFDTDADFRNAILSRFRMPRLPDGTVDKSAYNVDRNRALAAIWRIDTVPCFGVNPASRVFGYRGKQDLLVRLGIVVEAGQAQAPVPSPPATQSPPEAPDRSEPTPALGAILERLECVEERLDSLDKAGIPTSEIEALRLELESLRSLVEGIDTLRIELAEMREAELRVRIRQSNGTIIEDTVQIFDPSDSLNLQLPAR